MKKVLIVIVLTSLSFSIAKKANNEGLYDKALKIIIKENVLKTKNIDEIGISGEIIPFSMETSDIGIINKKIIENYDYYNDYSHLQKQKIDLLVDSLKTKDIEFNKNFVKKIIDDSKQIKVTEKTKYIVFFSNVINNRLYAEIREYNHNFNLSPTSEGLSYGKAYSFLFEVDDFNKNINFISYGYYYLN